MNSLHGKVIGCCYRESWILHCMATWAFACIDCKVSGDQVTISNLECTINVAPYYSVFLLMGPCGNVLYIYIYVYYMYSNYANTFFITCWSYSELLASCTQPSILQSKWLINAIQVINIVTYIVQHFSSNSWVSMPHQVNCIDCSSVKFLCTKINTNASIFMITIAIWYVLVEIQIFMTLYVYVYTKWPSFVTIEDSYSVIVWCCNHYKSVHMHGDIYTCI